MLALGGIGVLVTRPQMQAAPLCRMLEDLGALTVRLPTIDVKATGLDEEFRRVLSARPTFDFIIFTSANAVRFGVSLLEPTGGPVLAAIGAATARALNLAGHIVGITPLAGANSEALLAHPLFATPHAQRILIIKGTQGRPLLAEELSRRGASVTVAEVYRRDRPEYSPEKLADIETAFVDGRLQVVTATSAEIAINLLAIATPGMRRQLDRIPWVVPGTRVAEAVRAQGVTAPLLEAATAEDQDLLASIMRWRSRVSGA